MFYILLTSGIYKTIKEIENADTNDFLFWSEYLIRKRIVENTK